METTKQVIIIADELGYMNEGTRDVIVQRIDILGKQIRRLVSKLNPKSQSPVTI